MSEMIEWLRAQIEHRKTVAQNAPIGPWSARPEGGANDPDEWSIMSEGDRVCGLLWERAQADHIALNDPRDTIARCDAELEILDEHYGCKAVKGGEWVTACRMCSDRIPDEARAPGGDLWLRVEPSPCKTVRLIVSGYRHWPGWRKEWRP